VSETLNADRKDLLGATSGAETSDRSRGWRGWPFSGRSEKRPEVRERIEFLSRQAQERIAEKRQRLEEQLWAIHEADIGDCFETYEAAKVGAEGKLETDEAGKMLTVRKQRPKLLSDLPPDLRKAIEHVQVDARGNVVPQLYSKTAANAELRKMLNIGRTDDRPENDVSRLSDAELVRQLAIRRSNWAWRLI
jgi:hypothetical protein